MCKLQLLNSVQSNAICIISHLYQFAVRREYSYSSVIHESYGGLKTQSNH